MTGPNADWFARRTFHHRDFADLEALRQTKEEQGVAVSACIPALNEEGTIGPIVSRIRSRLMEKVPLIDELVVVDSLSDDDTVRVAEKAGAAVVQDRDILPDLEPASGKGEAMWKSLFVLKGDIILWLDADIENFHPRYVYGPVGTLLRNPDVRYAKAFYDRPIRFGRAFRSSEGGRVTELTARPILNLFWPELGQVIQPLAGEYAGRREALSEIPFFTGYGIEIGMLIDLVERFGVEAIAQVDLDSRVHRNRTIAELSRMAFAILQAVVMRLDSSGRIDLLTELNTSLTQFSKEGKRYRAAVTDLEILERPPAASIPEYRHR